MDFLSKMMPVTLGFLIITMLCLIGVVMIVPEPPPTKIELKTLEKLERMEQRLRETRLNFERLERLQQACGAHAQYPGEHEKE